MFKGSTRLGVADGNRLQWRGFDLRAANHRASHAVRHPKCIRRPETRNSKEIKARSTPRQSVAPSWRNIIVEYSGSHCVLVRVMSEMWDLGRGRTRNNTGNEEGKSRRDLPGTRMRETVRICAWRNQGFRITPDPFRAAPLLPFGIVLIAGESSEGATIRKGCISRSQTRLPQRRHTSNPVRRQIRG